MRIPVIENIFVTNKVNSETQYKIKDFLHRVDGPAVIVPEGKKEWYQNSKIHRDNGPAREIYGNKAWYVLNQYHRVDGASMETGHGHKEWRVEGKLHRLDGPARDSGDGVYEEWWENGVLQREVIDIE